MAAFLPMSISSTASPIVHPSFEIVFTKGYKLHTTILQNIIQNNVPLDQALITCSLQIIYSL